MAAGTGRSESPDFPRLPAGGFVASRPGSRDPARGRAISAFFPHSRGGGLARASRRSRRIRLPAGTRSEKTADWGRSRGTGDRYRRADKRGRRDARSGSAYPNAILPGPDYPRTGPTLDDEELVWPFLQIIVAADDADFEAWATRQFATDRKKRPKGVVEVVL